MKILIDNGHGEETPGKRSPDGRLREYRYSREIADKVVEQLKNRGIDAERIVNEYIDIPLMVRCQRVNQICKTVGARNVLLISIHCNAAGSAGEWMPKSSGWSAHVSLNASQASKSLALALIGEAEKRVKVRKYSASSPYWPQNLAICRDTHCAAVLVENMFQDNPNDVEFLLSERGRQTIVDIHTNAIINYISKKLYLESV